MPKDEIRRRVDEAARILDLEPYLKRKPRALSGGQRQRVAMGRAIVREPAVFLMDEPLSNLDAKLRVQMRADIKKIQGDLGATTIYVTHDQVEAMTMGDRVAVMRKGELQQVAPPQELYDRPVEHLRRRLHRQPGDEHARGAQSSGATAASSLVLGDARLELDEPLAARAALRRAGPSCSASGRRTSRTRRSRTATAGARLRGRVELREALGSEVLVHFTIAARQAVTDGHARARRGRRRRPRRRAARRGTQQRGDARRPVQPADDGSTKATPSRCAVDLRALHFFDPETGLAIQPRETALLI